jgi:outer membrane protein OmpA-like peptidoglycan-associated protein
MKSRWNNIGVGGAAASMLISLGGCATTQPPSELIQAREAYANSERSAAAKYDPAALHEAKVALDRAEKLFEEEEDARSTRDAAYIAMRRAERAKVEGQTAQFNARAVEAKKSAAERQTAAAQKTQQQLEAARDRLASAKQAREAAEARAQEAMTKLRLSQAVAMTEEPRGTVLTVPGAFLFASGKSQLQPIAGDKLDKIAEALKQQQNRKILIEGHTDSRGSNELNQRLSQERADAVASYLSSHGVPREQISAEGVGESRPIATNETPEGRAYNRRVEITVQRVEPR